MHSHPTHFVHPSAVLVSLDGVEFFIDSASRTYNDEHVGQMLCGWAWDLGADAGLWRQTLSVICGTSKASERISMYGEPVSDWELPGRDR